MTAEAPIMNPNLREFWDTKSRYKVLYGGRDSSKSTDTAIHAIRLANELPMRFLCVRMFQNRIEDSVYTLLKNEINRFGFSSDYTILNNRITQNKTGAEFMFYGLARNIEEIKSIVDIDVLWIEEGEFFTADMHRVLIPTIRREHSEIWMVFNPRLKTDFSYNRFVLNPPKNSVVRKINYDENPFLSNTSKETIQEVKEENYDEYLHVYEGYPKEDDDEVIIKHSWLVSCIDAHIKLGIEPSGERITGYDVADDGQDLNAYVNKYGVLITKVHQWKAKEDELVKSAKIVRNEALSFGSIVRYDSIGVGAGVGSNIKQLNDIDGKSVKYEAFNSGGAVVDKEKEYKDKVKNKDHFSNVKAQAWQAVADRVLETHSAITKGSTYDPNSIISISSECNYLDALLIELSTPKRDYDLSGKMKVESKKDMTKRGIKSPNLADAFVMCYVPKEQQKRAGVL